MGRGAAETEGVDVRVRRTSEEYDAFWQATFEEARAKGRGVNVARSIANAALVRLRAADAGRKPLGCDDIESYF